MKNSDYIEKLSDETVFYIEKLTKKHGYVLYFRFFNWDNKDIVNIEFEDGAEYQCCKYLCGKIIFKKLVKETVCIISNGGECFEIV